jgi:predicted permease
MKGVGIFAALIILVHAVMLGCSYLILRKKSIEPVYRIITIGTTFGNCAFFGIPIIEAMLPESASGLILYTTVYAVVMNVIGWTVGSAIISRDAKYISLKKILLNPAMLGFVAAIIFFVLGVRFNGTYTAMLGSMIQQTARMATPLSMIVMGMRLSTMKLSELFSDYRLYITIAVKQMFMPLIAFLIAFFLTGVDTGLRATFYITCSCPVASIVLNYSEIVGEGQKSAANLVLLSTALSILTLPLMMLLFPLIA